MSDPLKIALVGFGNIGTGVVRHLNEEKALFDNRLPRPLQLATICDVDLETDRGVPTAGIKMTSDFKDIVNDPSIGVVIELVGGTGIARMIVEESLAAGKHVVTANKALIATYGGELFEIADKAGVHLLFEASVGAGIPLINSLQRSLIPNRFTAIHGILNGTCNFILTAMEDTPGLRFESVLKEAMEKGYAEPDPTLDIEGIDAAHKIAIMGSLIFGKDLRIDNVIVQGITRIAPEDFAFAHGRGQTIKLLAMAGSSIDGEPALSVWPTFVPGDHLIGRVRGVTNTMLVDAEPSGPMMMAGAGAGQGSTSSGVLSDVALIAQALGSNEALKALNPLRFPATGHSPTDPAKAIHPERYLRLAGPNAQAAASRLAFPLLHEKEETVCLKAPRQSGAERDAMYASIEQAGVPSEAACEIRVALQDVSKVLGSNNTRGLQT